MRDHELTGFVNFPRFSKIMKTLDIGSTQIYIVAFGQKNESQKLELRGNFCGDDVSPKLIGLTRTKKLEEVVDDLVNQDPTNKSFYFREDDKFPVISSVLIGWSKFSYEYTDRIDPWCCHFRDLTNEGKKLYYSLKKLHNESEIRILTFNQIK